MADRDPPSIDSFLQSLAPRVGELESRARISPAATEEVLHDAIEQLRSTVEELEVVREELLVQTGILAREQVSPEHDARVSHDLLDLAPVACLATDRWGKLLACNRAAATLLGVRKGDLLGKPLSVFVAEGSRPEFRHRLNELRDGGAGAWEVVLKPRGRLPLRARARVAVGEARGGDVVLHWALRPLDGEDEGATAGTEGGALLPALFRDAPDGMAALDVDGTVLRWNPAAERLLGWSEDEVVGKPIPGLSEPVQARLLATRELGPVTLETEVREEGGRPLRLRVRAAPLGADAGLARGTVVSLSPAGSDAPADSARPGAPAAGQRSWTRDEALAALQCSDASREVQGRIRGWIAAGVHLGYLRPGDRLPSIREIAMACRADHRAVSLAYRTLAAEGVLEIRNRHGAYVAEAAAGAGEPPCESAGWMAGVLAEAAELRMRAALLPDLVRRWTASTAVRCACVESTEDDLAALTAEMRHQWGMDAYPVVVRDEGDAAPGRRADEPALPAALRGADLVVTTPFHEAAVRAVAGSLGIPVVVVKASSEMVEAAEERLRAGATLTAVVADARHGERLRALRGAAGRDDALRVVSAADADAVARLDPSEPVLLTRAAQQRLKGLRARLLVSPSHQFASDSARAVAEVLIRRNMEAERDG